ncbi:MAG: rRNA maturation RNase YbeY [bacterium]|nr:rRNA maturation RNase YbeY [bacterium]
MIDLVQESSTSIPDTLLRKSWYARIVKCVHGSIPDWKKMDIAVVLVDEKRIRALNVSYRGIDRVTDVLSFLYDDEIPVHGELYICVGQMIKQARRYGMSVQSEMERLVVHGVLHLQGYDHTKVQERKIMQGLERVARATLKKLP